MDIKDILELPFHLMTKQENLRKLVGAYKEELGREVCVSCPSSLNEMIINLKKHYNMSDFRIKNNGYYRLSKESSKTINNNIITNELAIEFLQIDTDRIKVFEAYPENWKEMVEGKDAEFEDTTEQEVEREILREMKMPELREKYPNIRATSKQDFITEIFKYKEA